MPQGYWDYWDGSQWIEFLAGATDNGPELYTSGGDRYVVPEDDSDNWGAPYHSYDRQHAAFGRPQGIGIWHGSRNGGD